MKTRYFLKVKGSCNHACYQVKMGRLNSDVASLYIPVNDLIMQIFWHLILDSCDILICWVLFINCFVIWLILGLFLFFIFYLFIFCIHYWYIKGGGRIVSAIVQHLCKNCHLVSSQVHYFIKKKDDISMTIFWLQICTK